MDGFGDDQQNRSYYDVFSRRYEKRRGGNAPGGYHELVDELEAELVARYGTGRDVLEVGCGTGLVLQRITSFARRATGVDVSPGMLERARARGLDVTLGSATRLPFEDASFDVTCSFKVLPHVREIELALREMARVTRPGGHVLAEFYNPHSFRGLLKRYGPKLSVGQNVHEGHVFLRLDSPAAVNGLIPPGCRLVDSRGIRIAIPVGAAMQLPLIRQALAGLERRLCDSPLKRFGGFWIAVLEKQS